MRFRVRATLAAATVAIALTLAGCGSPEPTHRPAPTSQAVTRAVKADVTVTVDGTRRSFLVWSPQHLASAKLPVIVALHGAGGNAAEFAQTTGFARLKSATSFIAVYPNGTPLYDNRRAWNAGTCCGAPAEKGVDDIGFLSAILDRLVGSFDADPKRVFLAGFSNGGMLAYRAACDIGPRIAGIAVVSGALNVSSCPSTNPMPVFVIHGTADLVVPFKGGKPINFHAYGLKPWSNASVAQAIAAWKVRDGCMGTPQLSTVEKVDTAVYADCAPGASITVRIRKGGQHVWPRGTAALIAAQLLGSQPQP